MTAKRKVRNGDGNGGMSVRQFAWSISLIGAALTGINLYIASTVLPQSEIRTRDLIDQETDTMVSRDELKLMVLDRLGALATRDQVVALSDRVQRLTDRVAALEAEVKELRKK